MKLRMWVVEVRGLGEDCIAACERHNALDVRAHMEARGFRNPVVRLVRNPWGLQEEYEFEMPRRCDICGRFGRWE